MTTEEWTPLRISALMALWNEGLSTSEIGHRLGVTKNAVVGKVHRLGLPKRQSPIRGNGGGAPRAASPGHAVTRVRAPQPVDEPPPTGEIIKLDKLFSGMCSWPDGEPGTEAFRFCGRPAEPGRPYCARHCERAYVKVSKERKETEAA